MAATLERQDSFKTALRNQKRRLSGVFGISPKASPKNTPTATPVRGMSPRGTPTLGLSPRNTPPRSTPIEEDPQVEEAAPPCSLPARASTPVPQDSPLLSPQVLSPALQRARSHNKDLRRAASFRAARDRSCSRNSSPANSRQGTPQSTPLGSPEREIAAPLLPQPSEVSFKIKRALGARKGWKIMSDSGEILDSAALKTVVGMIKDIEYQGLAVPERITIRVP